MEKIKIWYSIQNGGDGSAYPKWFLTEEDSEKDQKEMDEGWGEYCNGSVETFVGSDIHIDATENSEKLNVIKTAEETWMEKHSACPYCGYKQLQPLLSPC